MSVFQARTDLAIESGALTDRKAEEKGLPDGVKTETYARTGCSVTAVDVLDARGEKAVGKPVGRYVTLEFDARHLAESFPSIVETTSEEIRKMLPPGEREPVVVVGLGNWHITPDAVGPRTVENLMVTRHLVQQLPEHFSDYRPVAALAPGVLGITGMESFEVVKGVIDETGPGLVIAVDALVSRSASRLCKTVQIANTGISPGSGLGNHRAALNASSLQVPVLSIGVPTVVDAATLAYDMISEAGGTLDEEQLNKMSGSLIVAPKDADKLVADLAKLLGYSINMALHGFSVEEITSFLS